MTEEKAIKLIMDEYAIALQKYPSWPNDIIHRVAIMAEESGEAVQSSLNHVYHGEPISKLKREIIQTGAMAIRNLVNMEDGE